MNLSLATPAGSEPAALEWTVTYPSATIPAITIAAGPAAAASQKTLSCAAIVAGYNCILSGADGTIVSNGVVATVTASISSSAAAGTANIALTNSVAASPAGGMDPTSAAGGSVTVTLPAAAPITLSLSLIGITCNQNSVFSLGTTSCTVYLSGNAPSPVTVALSSNSALLPVPASVTVPANASSATFTATAGTLTLLSTTVNITASWNGASASTAITLANPITVSSLQCAPNSLGANAATTCIVTLNQPAPAGGAVVALSDNSPALTAPVSVTITAAATTATFAATTGALAASSTATITASLNGYSQTAAISLIGAASGPGISSLQCNPLTLGNSAVSLCVLKLSSGAPAAGAIIPLTVTSPDVILPPQAVIPAGVSQYNFTIATDTFSVDQTATVTASTGNSTQTVTLSLVAPVTVSSLQCAAAILANGSTSCTITLYKPAPAGGAVVALSNNSPALTVPATVTIPPGGTSAAFTITSGSSTGQTATITASLNGFSQSTTISLASPVVVSTLQCAPASLGPNGATTCTITLNKAAPSGGAAVTVSDNSASLTTPASVAIPAGATSGTFAATSGSFTAAQTATITASLNGASQTATISLVAPLILSPLQCAANTLGPNASTSCTVTLAQPAPAGGVTVTLSDNSAALAVPSSVAVAAAATSASFTASTASLSASQTAIVTASLNGASQSASLFLNASAIFPTLLCVSDTLLLHQGTACIVTLSQASPAGGTTVSISVDNPAVTVPVSVTVPPNATAATFFAVAGTFATAGTANVAAFIGSSNSTVALALSPAATGFGLLVHGIAAELTGVSNGSTVTPSVGPAGFTGTVAVNGSGSVTAIAGSGVSFQQCCSNTNNAYYSFTGAGVGSIFGAAQGQITFYLTSRYSYAARAATAAAARSAFDVRNGNGAHLFNFQTQVTAGGLEFDYTVAGSSQYYFVPEGTEDAIFGDGVTLKVALKWQGAKVYLYLNDLLVKTASYKTPSSNWGAASHFDLGGYEYLSFGGYQSLDDIIAEFTVN